MGDGARGHRSEDDRVVSTLDDGFFSVACSFLKEHSFTVKFSSFVLQTESPSTSEDSSLAGLLRCGQYYVATPSVTKAF